MNCIQISPRIIAIRALLQWQKKGRFLEETLNLSFDQHTFSAQDRHFAYELSFGTVRHWNTLLYYANNILNISIPKDELKSSILFIALYQRVFHQIKEKPHALVYEYVEIVKKLLSPGDRFVGFLNALLRKALLYPYKEDYLLQDSNKSPNEKLSVQYSIPTSFIESLSSQIGIEKTIFTLKALQQKPTLFKRGDFSPTTMQFYTQKIENLQQELAQEKSGTKPLYYVQNRTQPRLMECAIQSMLPLMDKTQKPLSILDLCSAPGGKALLVWNALNIMQIPIKNMILNEPNCFRQKRLDENRKRFQMNSTITSYDGRLFPIPQEELFDIILIDAPCSNSGVLFKCPEARYRLNGKALREHQKLQKNLLLHSLKLLSRSGFIIYTTCSILSEENEFCLKKITETNSCSVVTSKLILPDEEGNEGGFMGLLSNNQEELSK